MRLQSVKEKFHSDESAATVFVRAGPAGKGEGAARGGRDRPQKTAGRLSKPGQRMKQAQEKELSLSRPCGEPAGDAALRGWVRGACCSLRPSPAQDASSPERELFCRDDHGRHGALSGAK